ncbi:MAG: hypothetical protein L6V89_03690 [Oscillospiraceae bacterium]|nr:MAG: hypothetical protein L6V89_03690 [Oscillospiraceae bacterium]
MINVRLVAYNVFSAVVRRGGYSNLVLAQSLTPDMTQSQRLHNGTCIRHTG